MPKGFSRSVIQLDYDTGEEIAIYNTIAEAAFDNYISPKAVRKAINESSGKIDKKQLRFEYA